MDFDGQSSSSSAMNRQHLCNLLKAGGMAGVTQNLQEQDHFLGLISNNSLCQEILDGLLGSMKKQK